MLISKSVEELAQLVGGTICGQCTRQLHGVAGLSEATESDVSFLGNDKYRDQVATSRASVVLVPENYDVAPPEGRAWITCADPSNAFTAVVLAFTPPPVSYPPGIHASAVIDPTAEIGDGVSCGPGVVICAGAKIGAGTVLVANTYIGEGTVVGEKCLFYPGVVIRERCIVGNRVILHPGVIIGADGFGYKSSAAGHEKIPQVGIVQIDDDVEIGANSTVDRARFGRTWIQAGTKIDNLVQIGHNTEIGRSCMIVAQVGIAGSTHLGNGVILAGQVGVAGHLRLADGTIAMAQAGVSKDTKPGAVIIGTPAQDRREFAKERMMTRQVEGLLKQVKELKAALAELTNK